MKKALSLVEVLVAIVLITVIIGSVLQMQQNNLFFLDKFKQTSLYINYIALIADEKPSNRNLNIYLDEKIKFNDDEIRKEFKEIKITVKDEEHGEIKLPKNDYMTSIPVIKSTYNVNEQVSKTFYTFKIQ